MKLILFADRLPPLIGGMETHGHYFAQYFKDKFDFSIVSLKEGKNVILDNNYNLIQYIDLNNYLSNFKDDKLVLFFNSGRWIEDYTNIRKICPHALMMYRTGGNEIIQAPLTILLDDYQARKKYWVNQINDNINCLITNSNFTDKRLIDIGIKKDILFRINGGVDENVIKNAIELRENTRNKYNIYNGDKLLVCSARFVPYKRHKFLLEALSYVKTNFKLILAGDGPLFNEIKNKKYNYPIMFLGSVSQEESTKLIAASDLYVQASCDLLVNVVGGSYVHTEGMGRTILEALSTGVPVVCTSCGALPEIINDSNGALVNNIHEMANKIEYFLSNNIKIDHKANLDKYKFEKIFKEYIKLWD